MLLSLLFVFNASYDSFADSPSFLKVGKTYRGEGLSYITFTVLEVKNGNWIKAQDNHGKVYWLNIDNFSYIYELE